MANEFLILSLLPKGEDIGILQGAKKFLINFTKGIACLIVGLLWNTVNQEDRFIVKKK